MFINNKTILKQNYKKTVIQKIKKKVYQSYSNYNFERNTQFTVKVINTWINVLV